MENTNEIQFYKEIIGMKLSDLQENGYYLLQEIKALHDLVSEEIHEIEESDSEELSCIDRDFDDPRSLFLIYNNETDIVVDAFYAEYEGFDGE